MKKETNLSNKPKPNRDGIYDYNQCIQYLEKKVNKSIRDWSETEQHFQDWVTQNKKKTLYRKNWSAAKKLYQQSVTGQAQRPEYQDFWHLMCEVYSYNLSDGVVHEFSKKKWKPFLVEDWQREVFSAILEEFASKQGKILFKFN